MLIKFRKGIIGWHENMLIKRLQSRNFRLEEFDYENKRIRILDLNKRLLIISRIEAISLDRLVDWHGWKIWPETPEFM